MKKTKKYLSNQIVVQKPFPFTNRVQPLYQKNIKGGVKYFKGKILFKEVWGHYSFLVQRLRSVHKPAQFLYHNLIRNLLRWISVNEAKKKHKRKEKKRYYYEKNEKTNVENRTFKRKDEKLIRQSLGRWIHHWNVTERFHKLTLEIMEEKIQEEKEKKVKICNLTTG